MKNRLIRTIVVLTTVVGMLVSGIPVSALEVYASEYSDSIGEDETDNADVVNDKYDASNETKGADNSSDAIQNTEDVSNEAENTENSSNETYNTENDSDEILNTENVSNEAENTENDSDEIQNTETESAVLETEVIDAKERLSEDIMSLETATPGVDYTDDEVLLLCDNEEEAVQVAQEYSESIGREIIFSDYSYGVAVLKLGDKKSSSIVKDESLESVDTVKEIVELSADTNNTFCPVYPNYYVELADVDADTAVKYINTSNENFTDPMLKTDNDIAGTSNNMYQFFHEMVGSKYVFEGMDNETLYSQNGRLLKDVLADTAVAVIDTGINTDAYDFHEAAEDGSASNTTAPIYVGGRCFLATYASDNYKDDHGHGSNVSGIIADTANDIGGRGIASGVKIMPLKVFDSKGSSKDDSIIRGLNYAIKSKTNYNEGVPVGEQKDDVPSYNVNVINMSLGSFECNSLYREIIDNALDANIVICAAAGNYDQQGLFYPAAYKGTVSVGAINRCYEKSNFSNYGNTVDICAPGGHKGYSSDKTGDSYSSDELIYATSYVGTQSMSGKRGTSQAAPVVSGAVALCMAMYPDYSANDIIELIKESAVPVNSNVLGAGCVNVEKALSLDKQNYKIKTEIVTVSNMGTLEQTLAAREFVSSVELKHNQGINLVNPDSNGTIYYTLNGKEPDPANMDKTGTMIYSWDGNDADSLIAFNNTGTKDIVLKIKYLLYGNTSDTVSVKISFSDDMVSSIVISPADGKTSTGMSTISVGSKLALSADVFPKTAKNKNVIWSSSDTSSATVNNRGVVTARAETSADKPVLIKAAAADGADVYGQYEVHILMRAESVEIDAIDSETPMYKPDTVLLSLSDPAKNEPVTFDMSLKSGRVRVWPQEANQEVIYKSSNTKVIAVNESGIVEAKGPGNALITVTAADGSGKKDTLKFHVESPLHSLAIEDSKTGIMEGAICAGGRFTPKVIYNDGRSVPDNTTLLFSFSDSSYSQYASINSRTGVVTAKSNVAVKSISTITIDAYSACYNKKTSYSLDIYPSTNSIVLSALCANADKSLSISVGSITYIKNIIDVLPDNTAGIYEAVSSNPKVAVIDNSSSGLSIVGISNGTTFVTIKALDGSNKQLRVKVNVTKSDSFLRVGIDAPNGNIVCPGKKVLFKSYANGNVKLSRYEWYFNNDSDYFTVDAAGYVSVKPSAVIPKEGACDTLVFKGYCGSVYKTASIDVFAYNSLTSKVVIEGIENPDGTAEYKNGVVTMSKIGDSAVLNVSSIPETACQGDYAYVSTNSSVVSVNSQGVITANKNGRAVISVKSKDGSKRFTNVIIAVSQTRVKKVILPVSEISLSTIEYDGAENSYFIPNENITVEPIEACDRISAISLNNKIASVSFKTDGNSKGGFEITAEGVGETRIKFTAMDGSYTYSFLKVKVTEPVTSIQIKSTTGSFLLKPGRYLNLYAAVNKGARNTSVSWHFSDEEMAKYASLDPRTGRIIALKTACDDELEHVISVYAKANDKRAFCSNPVRIVISPIKVMMRDIKVKSSTDFYNLAGAGRLIMQATTSTDATDKRIIWSVDNTDYATISSTGILTAKRNLTERKSVVVRASAKDGSGVYGERTVFLYPRTSKIVIESREKDPLGRNITSISARDSLVLDIRSIGNNIIEDDSGLTCQRFFVTYTVPAGKVYLNNSDGSSVTLKGITRGRTIITVRAVDGSNVSAYYIVNIK